MSTTRFVSVARLCSEGPRVHLLRVSTCDHGGVVEFVGKPLVRLVKPTVRLVKPTDRYYAFEDWLPVSAASLVVPTIRFGSFASFASIASLGPLLARDSACSPRRVDALANYSVTV